MPLISAPTSIPTNAPAISPPRTVVATMYNVYLEDKTCDDDFFLDNDEDRIIFNPYFSAYDSSFSLFDITKGAAVTATSVTSATGNPSWLPGISVQEFLNLFYSTNAGYFNVNPSNASNQAVLLNSQTFSSRSCPQYAISSLGASSTSVSSYTYTTTYANNGSTAIPFSLHEQLIRAYCSKKGVSINSINPRVRILLQKEVASIQSLATVRGSTYSLGWDEVIDSLVQSNVITPYAGASQTQERFGTCADYISCATVPLSVIFNYYSKLLGTKLSCEFVYNVVLPGFVNSGIVTADQNGLSVPYVNAPAAMGVNYMNTPTEVSDVFDDTA
jgi:hypothetical protein